MDDDPLAKAVRAAVQAILDAEGDGYTAAQFVICLALERIEPDGRLHSTPWLWAPPAQADWMTAGLLDSAEEIHRLSSCDDDD